jgi:hypothetical protein
MRMLRAEPSGQPGGAMHEQLTQSNAAALKQRLPSDSLPENAGQQ